MRDNGAFVMAGLDQSPEGSTHLNVELDEVSSASEQEVTNNRNQEEQGNEYDNESTSNTPGTEKQREIVSQLIKGGAAEAREGDKVYVIPLSWYECFLNGDTADVENIGPINNSLICRDYENFILADYQQFPYVSIPESVFRKLMEWYGLAPGSKPIVTYLIYDESNQSLVTEYNRCILRLHYLLAQDGVRRYANSNRPIFLSFSSLSSIKDIVDKFKEAFFNRESRLSINESKIKVWYVKDSEINEGSSVLQSSYKLDPLQFIELPMKTLITPKLFSHTLKELKICAGDFVMEVRQTGENYHWASNYFMYNDLEFHKGTTGLVNLGNTCYMNSALQCLVHIPQLRDYFLYSGYEREINLENPLGHKGHIARAFSLLIQNLFGRRIGSLSTASYSPGSFKATIGRLNSMFAGYMQQDSQEFLAFLLDGLHEDLNRIVDKPYIEKPSLSPKDDVHDFKILQNLADETWNKHLLRNDSVITDLFVGLYESVLHCPECDNVSITFDPYNDLTLPLPVNAVWRATVKVFPQNSPPCSLEVEIDSTATYQDLKSYVGKHARIDPETLYGCEIFNHQFYLNYESAESNSKFLPLKELISESDDVVFYELAASETDIIVPILNTKMEEGFKTARLFGVPFFIVLSPEEVSDPGCIRSKLEKCYTNLSGGFVGFPLASLDEKLSIESLPLLQQTYQNVELEKFENLLSFSFLNNTDLDKFFSIKVLDTGNDQPLFTESKEAVQISKPFLWTPPTRLHMNRAKDITEMLSPVVSAIYDYPSFCREGEHERDQRTEKITTDLKSSTKNDAYPEVPNSNSADEFLDEKADDLKSSLMTEKSCIEPLLPPIIDPSTVIICEWSNFSVEEVFSESQPINWENPAKLTNNSIEQKKKASLQGQKKITLHDCLMLFSKKEVLGLSDSWYCPTCKDHRQATKQIQLWNTPDVLLIHLKRFENQRSFSDKIDDVVHFPITDLDMSEYLVEKNDPRGSMYDLIAVDNHYGGLGGGHYTAYAKNDSDQKWYYFDDSRVTETVPEQSISGSAYLLFYLRKSNSLRLGSPRLQEIIDKSRRDYELKIQEVKEKQTLLYKTNETDSEEDENTVEDHTDLLVADFNDNKMGSIDLLNTEANTGSVSSNDNVGSARSTDYSIESLEVGRSDHTQYCDDDDNNIARRKLRLISKKYDESSIGNSPVSSDDAESLNMDWV